MRQNAVLLIQSQILGRIEALRDMCTSVPVATLCEQLDDLRALARRHGFDAVERLASMLESVVAYNGHRQVALTYLELMRDAATGVASADSARVYLAAAALRGCR